MTSEVTQLPLICGLHGMELFPSQDFLPGLLIILVVNPDDVCHIFLFDIIIVPAPSGESLSHKQ